jgi:hypothetical protein
VRVDIRPGDSENAINPGSHGVVPVAVLGEADFDAATVDPASVRFAGAQVRAQKNGKLMASLEDANGDGLVDLLMQFSTDDLLLRSGGGDLELFGATFAGQAIHGQDAVKLVGSDAAAARRNGKLRTTPAMTGTLTSELAILGASPNPVAESSVLSFSLAADGPAVLELWSVSGRLVQRRELGTMGPGEHRVGIGDAARLAPGTYVVCLRQGAARVATKISVLR